MIRLLTLTASVCAVACTSITQPVGIDTRETGPDRASAPMVILVTPEEKTAMDARAADYAVAAECPEGVALEPNAQPILRRPPIFPPTASRSGSCDVTFNVNAKGYTKDVVADTCTDPIFMRPSVLSINRYEFTPRMQDGRAVSICGVKTKISFILTDENGARVPE
mgnify:CR=1 FL=1